VCENPTLRPSTTQQLILVLRTNYESSPPDSQLPADPPHANVSCLSIQYEIQSLHFHPILHSKLQTPHPHSYKQGKCVQCVERGGNPVGKSIGNSLIPFPSLVDPSFHNSPNDHNNNNDEHSDLECLTVWDLMAECRSYLVRKSEPEQTTGLLRMV
jgi:hypothetical protein